MNKHDIKQKVLANKLLGHILNQIDNPIEKEKTIHAINGLLDEFQGKANSLVDSYSKSQNSKKEDDK